MPQVQVINREQDPLVKQISEAGNDVSDALFKKKTIEATKHYYDILGKQAETDIQKSQLEDKKFLLGIMDKAQTIRDPEVRSAYVTAAMRVHGSRTPQTLASVGEDLETIGKSLKPAEGEATDAELRGAQTKKYSSEGDLNAQIIELLKNQGGGGTAAPAAPGAPASSDPTAAGVPGMMMGGMNVGGLQLTNPQADYQQARANALGRESVPQATAEQKDSLRATENQLSMVSEAENMANKIKTHGPVQGRLANVVSGMSGGDSDPNFKTYIDYQPALALGLYGAISGDNSKLSDQDAMLRAAPLIWRPQEGEGRKVRAYKFKLAKTAITVRQKMLKEGNYTVGPDGTLITPMEKVVARAKTEMQNGAMESFVAQAEDNGYTRAEAEAFWRQKNGQ